MIIKSTSYKIYKYNLLILIQYLISITEKQFKKEFYIQNEEHLKQLSNCIINGNIDSIDKLKMNAAVIKYFDNSFIDLLFNDNFKFEDIPDGLL